MPSYKELSLLKGDENYVFRYTPGGGAGEQQAVLNSIVDCAKNKNTNIDWFDAVILSSKLSRQIIERTD